MIEQLFIEIEDMKSVVFFLLISLARPAGFLTTFALMSFALKRGALFQIALAISIGLPIMAVNVPTLNEVFAAGSLLDRVFLPAKETIIGLALGMLASLPFLAFQFAGHLCDSYRAEGSNQLGFMGSDTTTTGGLILFLALSLNFVSNEGLWHLFEVFYSSYLVWPIEVYLPALKSGSIMLVADELLDMFLLMVRVGLPLLIILLMGELFLIIASRIGRRYGFNNFSFHIKNVVFLFVMPLYIVYVIRVAGDIEGDIFDATRILSEMFE
jgi:type III secretory pathway component EscT